MASAIFIILGISIAVNLSFFFIAFALKKDVFTDITYAATFLLTTIIVMIMERAYNVADWLVLGLIGLWSLRLGTFLFIRILKAKVDHRFDKMRHSFWKFGAFWLLQAITVWLVNMPTYIILLDHHESFNFYQLIPLIFALVFLAFETWADWQKYQWNLTHHGQFIHHGLWKISRHPNYFGELSFWWMLMIMALVGHYQPLNWLSLIGPVYITLTLYKISGLPLLEKQSWKRFGDDLAYQAYLAKTPTLLPWIGQKGLKAAWKKK